MGDEPASGVARTFRLVGRTIRELAREERVRILLRTRNDDYPSPRAMSIPSTPSGPGGGRKRKCPGCDGSGKVRQSQLCPVCEGQRKIEVDSYVGRVSGADTRRPEPMSPAQIEAELERLALQLDRTGRIDPQETFGWERAIQRRDRAGSYRELEHILAALRQVRPAAFDFLLWIYGTGLDVELTAAAKRTEEELVAAIAKLMPSKIKLPHHLARELAERKEDVVLRLSRDGVDIEEIAEAALLSVRTVQKLLSTEKRATKAHAAATISA